MQKIRYYITVNNKRYIHIYAPYGEIGVGITTVDYYVHLSRWYNLRVTRIASLKCKLRNYTDIKINTIR